MTRGMRRVGCALVGMVALSVAAAPVLAPNPPTRQFEGLAYAPPMRPRIFDAQGLRRPFVYPWRVTDRLQGRFEPDTSRPQVIRFFTDGRVAAPQPPEPWFLLGADPLGRDVLARVLAGGRLSLGVAALAVLLTLALGASVGAIAGFVGGRIDRTIMAVADFAVVLPLVYVVVTLRAAMPPVLEPPAVFWTMVVVMALGTWPVPARGVRAIVAAERSQPYAESAYAVGGGPLRILLRHLLPAAAGHIGMQGFLLFPAFIFAEATLSFVGLGFAEPLPSWGVMLKDAAAPAALIGAPWLLAPAGAIVLTLLGVHLVLRSSERATSGPGGKSGSLPGASNPKYTNARDVPK
jgi:peptide/nickel transport system permease protein